MKYFKLGLALALFILLGSCNPFEMNLYSSFDKMDMPNFNDGDALLDSSSQKQLYKHLKENPSDKNAALKALGKLYGANSTADTKTQQKAAIMATDVMLKTSGADEVLENLNNVANDAINGKEIYDPDKGPEDFVKTLFGEKPSNMSQTAYKEKIKEQLKAFNDAAGPLNSYGNNLKNGEPISEDTNVGDLAIKAVMAGVTNTIIENMKDTNEEGDSLSDDEKLEKLAEYLAAPEESQMEIDYKEDYKQPDKPSDILKDGGNAGLLKVVNDFKDIDELFEEKKED